MTAEILRFPTAVEPVNADATGLREAIHHALQALVRYAPNMRDADVTLIRDGLFWASPHDRIVTGYGEYADACERLWGLEDRSISPTTLLDVAVDLFVEDQAREQLIREAEQEMAEAIEFVLTGEQRPTAITPRSTQ